MKIKTVILGLCSFMSACGLNQGDRNHSTEKQDQAVTATLKVTNSAPQGYLKLRQAATGNRFFYLGSFNVAELPKAWSGLLTESEVGELSAEFEDEAYASRYDAEITPVFKKHTEALKVPVYLLKNSAQPEQFILAMKQEGSAQLNAREEAVSVQSRQARYCYRAHFGMIQAADRIAIPEQDAICKPSAICDITVRFEYPSNHDGFGTYNINENKLGVAISCSEYQYFYSRTEIRMNRSVPITALIEVNPALSGGIQKIQFSL